MGAPGLQRWIQRSKAAIRAGQLWRRDKTAAMQRLVGAGQQFGSLLRLFGIRIEEYRHHH